MARVFHHSGRLIGALSLAIGVAFSEAAERIYVTSAADSTVQEFDGSGVHLGVVLTPAGVPGDQAIAEPAALSFDPAGALWVTSAHNNLVGKILPNGTAQIVIGSGLTRPQGLCFDPAGRLFVVNEGEGSNIHTVAKYDVSGASPVLLATYGGPPGFPFALPHQVSVKGDGTAYVADVVAHTVSTIAPDGTMAVLFLYADQAPVGVALDRGGFIYVSFYRSNEIRKYSPDGTVEFRRDLGGGQTLPFINTSFTTNPPDSFNRALVFDDEDNLYVPNQATGTVAEYDHAGNLVRTFGGGHLQSPYAMAILPALRPTSPNLAREGGGYRFSFHGPPAHSFGVEFANSLAPSDWQPLGTTTTDAQGLGSFLDLPASSISQRFYRATSPP